MSHLRLNDEWSLGIELLDQKARLVVYQHQQEIACRKETLGKLKLFMEQEHGHAFKGRVQLYKQQDAIAIQVSGHLVGTVRTNDFKQILSGTTK